MDQLLVGLYIGISSDGVQKNGDQVGSSGKIFEAELRNCSLFRCSHILMNSMIILRFVLISYSVHFSIIHHLSVGADYLLASISNKVECGTKPTVIRWKHRECLRMCFTFPRDLLNIRDIRNGLFPDHFARFQLKIPIRFVQHSIQSVPQISEQHFSHLLVHQGLRVLCTVLGATSYMRTNCITSSSYPVLEI